MTAGEGSIYMHGIADCATQGYVRVTLCVGDWGVGSTYLVERRGWDLCYSGAGVLLSGILVPYGRTHGRMWILCVHRHRIKSSTAAALSLFLSLLKDWLRRQPCYWGFGWPPPPLWLVLRGYHYQHSLYVISLNTPRDQTHVHRAPHRHPTHGANHHKQLHHRWKNVTSCLSEATPLGHLYLRSQVDKFVQVSSSDRCKWAASVMSTPDESPWWVQHTFTANRTEFREFWIVNDFEMVECLRLVFS